MTREEHIDNLKSFVEHFKDEIEHSGFGDARFDEEQAKKDIETFKAAIQALSQEPCTDAVSREAVIEATHHCGDLQEVRGVVQQLPSVNPQPCDDAISREELLKAIDTWDKFGVDDTNSLFRLDNLSLPYYVPYIHYDDVIKCIKGMPSVTQKSGKWIDYSYEEGYVECPFCGYATTCEDNIDELHYCFWCGARMFEPQESEEQTG